MSIKRILSVAVAVSATAAVILSCGGSKTTASGGSSGSSSSGHTPTPTKNYTATTEVKKGEPLQQTGQGVEIENVPCQDSAYVKNAPIRDWGLGVSTDQSMARDIADLQADEKLARNLNTFVTGAMSRFADQTDDADDIVFSAMASNERTSMWKEAMQGASVICGKTYREGNKYKMFITKEISYDKLDAVYNKAFKENSNKTREQLEARREKFREYIKEEREKFSDQNRF
jgi:hypothetical protein